MCNCRDYVRTDKLVSCALRLWALDVITGCCIEQSCNKSHLKELKGFNTQYIKIMFVGIIFPIITKPPTTIPLDCFNIHLVVWGCQLLTSLKFEVYSTPFTPVKLKRPLYTVRERSLCPTILRPAPRVANVQTSKNINIWTKSKYMKWAHVSHDDFYRASLWLS